MDTNLQVCVHVHVSVTTQVNAHKHLAITHHFLFTSDKYDVTVIYVNRAKSNNMAHTPLHVPFCTLDIGRCPHNETCTIVGEGLARGQVRYSKYYVRTIYIQA